MTLSKRVSKLEIKSADAIKAMAEVEKLKRIAAREQWRKDNYQLMRWRMFMSLYGPDSDWYKCPDPEPEELAYAEAFREILKHYTDEQYVNYEPMTTAEKGFAFVVEQFFKDLGDDDLLYSYLWQYGSDLPSNTPLDTLAKLKIEADGLEWLQICYNDEQQEALEGELFEDCLSENFML